MSEDQEIISRPPSHPVATTALIVSCLCTLVAIGLVWAELFGDYLHGAPASKDLKRSMRIADRHIHDHYAEDFKGGTDPETMYADIEKELGITSVVGGTGG